jgi:hypothetical protein
LIDENWPVVDSLALELVRKREMGQAEIDQWRQGFRSRLKIVPIDPVELDVVLESICTGGKHDEFRSIPEVSGATSYQVSAMASARRRVSNRE